jgi:spermidine synthase
MKPRIKLAETTTPDGSVLSLFEHDGAWSMSLNGAELMHSKASASECLLGELGIQTVQPGRPVRILIGGLGLGFTLKTVLETVGAEAVVEVVELLPDVVEWSHDHLQELNGRCLDDPRVRVVQGDVGAVIRKAPEGLYDAILLDIDNGPVAMVSAENRWLYSSKGLRAVRRALNPKGRAVLWSAGEDKAFENRLRQLGFSVRAVPAKVHESAKRAAYLLYVADRCQAIMSP